MACVLPSLGPSVTLRFSFAMPCPAARGISRATPEGVPGIPAALGDHRAHSLATYRANRRALLLLLRIASLHSHRAHALTEAALLRELLALTLDLRLEQKDRPLTQYQQDIRHSDAVLCLCELHELRELCPDIIARVMYQVLPLSWRIKPEGGCGASFRALLSPRRLIVPQNPDFVVAHQLRKTRTSDIREFDFVLLRRG